MGKGCFVPLFRFHSQKPTSKRRFSTCVSGEYSCSNYHCLETPPLDAQSLFAHSNYPITHIILPVVILSKRTFTYWKHPHLIHSLLAHSNNTNTRIISPLVILSKWTFTDCKHPHLIHSLFAHKCPLQCLQPFTVIFEDFASCIFMSLIYLQLNTFFINTI